MRLRLKEQPAEWRKFAITTALALTLIGWFFWWRRILPGWGVAPLSGLMGLLVLVALAKPRWMRGFYRAGMTVSFHLGQVMGQVVLTVFFFLVLTPLGLMMRLVGKDLLKLKKSKGDRTYWHEVRGKSRLDQMF